MSQIARVQMPDGRIARLEVPDGTTPDQVESFVKGMGTGQPTTQSGVGDVARDVAMGAVRGASRIGSTILRPLDATGITGMTNKERVASLDEFFKDRSDPESLAFKVGDVGTQIAGTAGVGGLFAKGAQALNAAPKVVNALQSGGLTLGGPTATTIGGQVGNAALRTGAGAVTGGAMAGLVNPEDAKTGAVIGGSLPGAVKVAGMAGSGLRSIGEHILGMMTGTGRDAIKGAIQAGQTGSKDFLENMRGNVSFDDVVDAAKRGLQTMRQERGNAYRSGMVDIKADKSVLDMSPITKAVDDLSSAGSFKGKTINEKSSGVVKEIKDKVDDWAKSDPKDFHTPEGLDALKQAVGDIRDSTEFGSNARRAADSVYNTIKNQIQSQAPTYSKVMKDYQQASETIKEIEKALSLGNKASKDTAVRKLQSLMRNNAQTNYGNRLDLARTLEEKGNVSLGPSLAGQTMSSWTPRGMVGTLEKGGVIGASLLGSPGVLAAAPLMSPRLVGESLYGLGRLSSGVSQIAGAPFGLNQLGGQNLLLEQALANPALRAGLLTSVSR